MQQNIQQNKDKFAVVSTGYYCCFKPNHFYRDVSVQYETWISVELHFGLL